MKKYRRPKTTRERAQLIIVAFAGLLDELVTIATLAEIVPRTRARLLFDAEFWPFGLG